MAINPNDQYTLSGSQLEDLRDYVQAATELPASIVGSTAPTTSTAANVGQLYLNTTTDKTYICTAKTAQGTTPETYLYTWEEIGGANYTAGNGLNLSNNEFSVDTTEIQEKLTAGNNITITTVGGNEVISSSGSSITMSSTDPGEGSVLAANNYVAVYGGDPIIEDYSTLEVNTGAKWIDGTAIYKKTLLISSLPNTGQGTYYHNIPNINLVINIEGFYMNDEGTFFPANTVRPGDTSGIGTFVDPLNTLIISVGSKNRTNYHGYVTLYYTKSS